MYNSFSLTARYLKYYLTAANGRGHGIHSPFVFDFIVSVLNDRQHYPAYDVVEKLRQEMRRDERLLTITDFGAGSVTGNSKQRSISSIARSAAKPRKYGQLLYRMVKKYHPNIIVELGTSLGITTSYLASAHKTAVISLEGAKEVADVARKNFESLQLQNIAVVDGNFDDTFPPLIDNLYPLGFCFIDGNHRRDPTERYFAQLLPRVSNDTILVFDDIHWSADMEEAWETIKTHKSVRCTIDLFFIGIVLFREEFKEKQHFTIRF